MTYNIWGGSPISPSAGFHAGVLRLGWSGNWKCWFFRREENWRTQSKSLGVRQEPTSNSTHISKNIPGPHWLETSALTITLTTLTTPSLLP